MQNLDLAIVDIETTGGNSLYHRIIEVAVLRVKEGRVVDSFSSLIDPQRSVPPFVEHLTGIKTRDLRGAPTFREVKDRLYELLSGSVFVAHNAHFDYGFLRDEFDREDIDFSARCLCTVRLSRLLFPEHKRHSLDSIIERLGIVCEDRHRAMGDAKAVWQFLNFVRDRFAEDQVQSALGAILKAPTLPPLLDEAAVTSLPESPGAYVFYDRKGKALYVGRSVNIKSRVLSHFSGTPNSVKQTTLARETASVEAVATSGELGALLTESHLVKKLHPVFNRKSRFKKLFYGVRKLQNEQKYGTVEIVHLEKPEIGNLSGVVALFPSRKAATEFLWDVAKAYCLCPKILGLEKTNGPCFYNHLKICEGACTGTEPPAAYNLKFEKAFSASKIRLWPFPGPILIEERGRGGKKGEAFLVDNWCLLDSFRFDESGRGKLFQSDYVFDYEGYRIIADYLFKSHRPVSFKELSRAEAEALIDG